MGRASDMRSCTTSPGLESSLYILALAWNSGWVVFHVDLELLADNERRRHSLDSAVWIYLMTCIP